MPSAPKQNDAVAILSEKLPKREVIDFHGVELVSPRATLRYTLKNLNLEELAADEEDDFFIGFREVFSEEKVAELEAIEDVTMEELTVLTMWVFGNVQRPPGAKPVLWADAVDGYLKAFGEDEPEEKVEEAPKARPKTQRGARSRSTSK